MEYMILPIPKEGSMTLGVISSTEDKQHLRILDTEKCENPFTPGLCPDMILVLLNWLLV